MSVIDTAKELLKKGMELNDPELIKMANTLLATVETPPEEPKEEDPQKDSLVTRNEDNFISSITDDKDLRSASATPVNQGKRKNLFVDDKIEAMDVTTPSYKPTARDRKKAKRVEQKCEECRKTSIVPEAHARDFFVCDSCLVKRRR
mgnify:CR=1 FL=1|tara:strand:+ start:171 stop:611 length:441 start_codon:yes stop_codon:yes gene_type:complete